MQYEDPHFDTVMDYSIWSRTQPYNTHGVVLEYRTKPLIFGSLATELLTLPLTNIITMAADTRNYEYGWIDAKTEIRILVLQPAEEFSDPLEATMMKRKMVHLVGHCCDEPLPIYQAVSYCWGQPLFSLFLICDGRCMPITPTVDSMLRCLRKRDVPRNLWIDALCIDQNNNDEKAKQVRNMGKIYGDAEKVHVWLGMDTPDDRVPSAFAVLQDLARDELLLTKLEEGQESKELRRGLLVNEVEPLSLLLSRPWFRRRWILQAVALAQDVTIHCGLYKLAWNWMRDGIRNLHEDLRYLTPNRTFPLEVVHSIDL
jgi:hypothetical protein